MEQALTRRIMRVTKHISAAGFLTLLLFTTAVGPNQPLPHFTFLVVALWTAWWSFLAGEWVLVGIPYSPIRDLPPERRAYWQILLNGFFTILLALSLLAFPTYLRKEHLIQVPALPDHISFPVLLYFLPTGLLRGYGKMRSWRPRHDVGHDQQTATRADLNLVAAALAERIERLQANPTLDKFNGVIAARLKSIEGYPIRVTMDEDRIPQVSPEQCCRLEVSFKRSPDESDHFHDRLVISEGNNADRVTFEVAIDSDDLTLEQRTAQLVLRPSERADHTFVFVAPQPEGRHDFFLETTQKNRLVHVLRMTIDVVSL